MPRSLPATSPTRRRQQPPPGRRSEATCPPRAVAGMLLAVGVTQGADAITFVRMVRDHGTAVELNPLVARLAAAGELAWLLILKAALVVLVVAIFAVLVRRHVVVGSLVATLAVMAGIVGAYSNVAVIVGPGRGPLPL